MNFCARRFNLYLLLPLLAVVAAGCVSTKKEEPLAAFRVHIESTANAPDRNIAVSVLRSKPVLVPVSSDPFLTEANVIAAQMLDTPGGFAVEIKFDSTGTWMLEQYSAANPGRHLAIFAEWGLPKAMTNRWLAAPLISHRIPNGLLAFTPDASREEVGQLVLGLGNVAKKNLKGPVK